MAVGAGTKESNVYCSDVAKKYPESRISITWKRECEIFLGMQKVQNSNALPFSNLVPFYNFYQNGI